ncbi:hypothetical protein PVL29_003667 [Vitis rotundifolia]|uniref:KRR1 small subunit processome component second KH domain-containing protein n=1 Tax=Vitis rotundifolia TaxID=103349 RepID=A0AA39E3E7_VITRO|nr:hypothetical protein PVL29_003667 [Vitis rotundifolia]
MKARDLIKLLSRSVPAPQAIKILNDEMQCDIIKIGNLVRNKERFVKCRQHLVGPNSSTLKALEILTGCYILVQGNTVAAMGSFKGLKQVQRVVEDCIQNKMHPVCHIKGNRPAFFDSTLAKLHSLMTLMMKRELASDPALENENWDRFLPKFKKKNVKQKKVQSKEKNGEYFLSDQKKFVKKWQHKLEKQTEKTAENKRKREAAFVPPMNDVAAMAMSLKKKAKEFGKQKSLENVNPKTYIAASGEAPLKKKRKHSQVFDTMSGLKIDSMGSRLSFFPWTPTLGY